MNEERLEKQIEKKKDELVILEQQLEYQNLLYNFNDSQSKHKHTLKGKKFFLYRLKNDIDITKLQDILVNVEIHEYFTNVFY